MNFTLDLSPGAERKIHKRCSKDALLAQKVEKVTNILALTPFYTSLKTHKIISKVTGKEAFSSWITGDYRIIWSFKEDYHILIVDFGTHNEVYL